MTKKEQRIKRLFFYAGILTLIYYLGQGITVRFGQSLLYLWLMLSAVCFGRFFLWKWAWKHGKSAPIPRLWLRAVNIVVIAAVAVFLAVECLVFSGAFQKPPEGLDAIIVLGARVDENGPSGSLRQRISAARVYLEENPDTVCIASGGQGEDEPMSEAECIRDHLVAGCHGGAVYAGNKPLHDFRTLVVRFGFLRLFLLHCVFDHVGKPLRFPQRHIRFLIKGGVFRLIGIFYIHNELSEPAMHPPN